MKNYYKLLLIFLFCSTFFISVSFREKVVAQSPTEAEKTEAVEAQTQNETTTDSAVETEEKIYNENDLGQIFPGCPLVDETVPSVIIETKFVEPELSISDASGITLQDSYTSTESVEDTTEKAANDSEPENVAVECPTPKEINRYREFIKADRLYLEGDKESAVEIYKELKESWDIEQSVNNQNQAIYDPEELSPGGRVYWRTYQTGKEQQLESKIFAPLELLVTKDANFIPGHVAYTEELLAKEREEEAYAVMEKAIGLYPNEVALLRAKIDTDIQGGRWLEASIAARQFALFNPDHPDSEELTTLADVYLEEYQDEVEEELTWNAIGNAITGAAGFALTGNIFGPLSAIDTTIMLLQGESNLGDRFAKRIQKQLPMVEDEEVVNYVQEIGHKIAAVAGRDEFEYEFFVLMDDNLNAFALPGGKIFVNAGAIMKTDTEAELAGLLAHEVSHSVLSHGFQLVTRGSLTSNVAQYIPYVGGTASNLIVMNYSRDMEKQADIFGTRILVAADYTADGVRDLMAKLDEIKAENEEYEEPPAWLSTHPNTSKRVNYIEQLVVDNNLNRYAYEGVAEHQMIKQKMNQLWQEYEAEQAEKEKDK